jgi:DNA-binding SARP family transcriptional activator
MEEFRVLGPLEVRSSDGELLPIPRQARALLSVLLIHAGQPCSVDVLADALWGEDLPAEPAAAIRRYIHALRRALGTAASKVVTIRDGYGYQVNLGRAELDLYVFRDRCANAAASLAGGDLEAAATSWQAALGCWRAPPFKNLQESGNFLGEVAVLLEERRAAQIAWGEANLALGNHFEIVGALRRAVADDPLCEATQRQLVLSLYRCGRKAAALIAAGEARRETLRHVGADPSSKMGALIKAIMEDSPDLDPRPPGAHSTPPRLLGAATANSPIW